jgi:hypothetical protein
MKTIFNCQTGEVIERELNKSELDQQKKDEVKRAAERVEAEEHATARQAILDRLGLTADEAALLLG